MKIVNVSKRVREESNNCGWQAPLCGALPSREKFVVSVVQELPSRGRTALNRLLFPASVIKVRFQLISSTYLYSTQTFSRRRRHGESLRLGSVKEV